MITPHTLPDPDLSPAFYADVPSKRLVAWIIDSLLIIALMIVIIPFTGFLALFMLPAVWLILSLVYRIVSLTRHSATPGMRVMSIQMRAHTGAKFGLGEAVVHTLIYTTCISFVLPQVISVLLMATNSHGRGLGDIALGSVMINRPISG
jgi:uncharacterized RDD family membrane protein YckC